MKVQPLMFEKIVKVNVITQHMHSFSNSSKVHNGFLNVQPTVKVKKYGWINSNQSLLHSFVNKDR